MNITAKEIKRIPSVKLADFLNEYHLCHRIEDEDEYRLFMLIRELGELRIDEYPVAIEQSRIHD